MRREGRVANVLARTWTLALLLGTTAIIQMLINSPRAAAQVQNLPPWYSHSWYVVTTDLGRISSLGDSDGVWDTQHCYSPTADNGSSNKVVVLNFGRPIRIDTAPSYFNGYGTVMTFGGPTVSDDQIVQVAEFYLSHWFSSSGSCPRLTLALGTNNSYLCANSPAPCDPAAAGQAWAASVDRLQSWVTGNGWGWQITVAGGADFEGDGYPPWSCAAPTRSFIDGYGAGSTSRARLYDFGDPFTSAGCWSESDVYYAAWGATLDWPLAEVYSPYFLGRWTDGSQGNSPGLEATFGAIHHMGVMTECTGLDQLPDANCSVNGSVQWSWKQAWNGMWGVQSTTYGQVDMPWATNIRVEP